MKLLTAFLAGHGIAQENGRFSVLDGGIRTIDSASIPHLQRNLALVLSIEFDLDETGTEFPVRISLTGPKGQEVIPTEAFWLAPTRSRSDAGRPPGPVAVPVIHNMRDVNFDAYGTYSFSVNVGSDQTTVLVDIVEVLRRTPNPDEAETVSSLLNTGYRAFRNGDLDGAAAIFRDLSSRFPDLAVAHNDLGFVLLNQGKADIALVMFERGLALGFPLGELARANIACCHYLLGRFDEAFSEFRGLLGEKFQVAEALLHAVGRPDLTTMVLRSAADYIALMAVNASYSALATNQLAEAQQFAQIATTGLLSFQSDGPNGRQFELLLQELNDACHAAAKGAPPASRKGPGPDRRLP